MQFTPVSEWPKGIQDASCANEIIESYIERRLVLGQGLDGITPRYVGQNSQQGWWLWNDIGQWLEDNCVEFLDTSDIENESYLSEDKSGFVNYTKETWQNAAGLDGCYRRKQNMGDDWSYGQIVAGDIMGPWTFEDLQKGLGVLRWTLKDAAYKGYYKVGRGTGEITLEDAKARAQEYFEPCVPVETEGVLGSNYATIQPQPYGIFNAYLEKSPTVFSCELAISWPVNWGLYVYMQQPDPAFSAVVLDTPFSDPVFNEWLKIDNGVVVDDDKIETDMIGNFDTPVWPEIPPSDVPLSHRGYQLTYAKFVLEWSFSYTS